ncbi:MAG: glycosyltransferase [Candidatus Uhrbacteria bacterium]
MIRIVHVITSFDIGGAEQFVLDLCRRIDRRRFEVAAVVAVVRGGPMRTEFHEVGIPTEVIGKNSKLGIGAIRRLTADLRSLTPDLVHTHLFGGDTWGRIAALRAGVPHLVSTEQNTNLDEGAVKRFVKRMLARRTDRIVAVSDAVRSYSIRVDHIPRGKIAVIPNGVDVERFRPSPPTPRRGVRFLAVGRFVPQKGLEVLLDAFAIIRDVLPDATLEIVGDGPLRSTLEAQVHSYHLADRVMFLGFRRDTAQIYTRADVLVMPSRWEGFGIAAVEAAACGLPVVASAVGGLMEVVVDQETGILVPPGEPKLLADAMRDLATDAPRRILFGHAGRRHVEKNYNIRRVVERYEELYEELVSKA